jgi:hypothetical protein
MQVAYQNAWDMLSKYNNLTDNRYEIYAAATLLNPGLRIYYFNHFWSEFPVQKELMLHTNREIWEVQYRHPTTVPALEAPHAVTSSFSAFLANIYTTGNEQQYDDAFKRYTTGKPSSLAEWKERDLFQWWAQCEYPELRQWAFDTLSIPAMSAELERVFSQAKRFITDDRNRLLPETFEALMLLKHWSLQDIYSVVTPLGTPEDESEPIR